MTIVLLAIGACLVPALSHASRALAVAAGLDHTCAVTSVGGVKCWGANSYGQLGDGTATQRATPTGVAGLKSGVVAVASGDSHTCAVTTGGGVKCWGRNQYGQLGDGTTIGRTTPTDVTGLASGVAAVAAGGSHTCAVTAGGGVKCWGQNSYGQLGDGTTSVSRDTPTGVVGLVGDVAAVAAGYSHTCAVTTGGGLKCWGRNQYGQLGDGTTTGRTTPTDVTGLANGVATVAAGGSHTCAVTAGGGVKCWGGNYSGQVGDGTTTMRTTPTDVVALTGSVVAVGGGDHHSCAVTTGGGVKCWGSNRYGQLGDGTTTSRMVPTDVSRMTGGAVATASGQFHSCAVTTGGGVTCWGRNAHGQLGEGTTTSRPTPTDVPDLTSGVASVSPGDYHACAVTTGGAVKCWGYNDHGQLGDGTRTSRTTPTDVAALTSGALTVAAGESHTCALTTGGGVKCWGDNSFGQLGDGTRTSRLSPTDVVGLTSGLVAISSGAAHTCAVTTAGGVKCWGWNYYGQLGDGTTTDRVTATDVAGLASGVEATAGGFSHTCVVTTTGAVKCWGQNNYGELGDGTTTDRVTPTDVAGLASGAVAVAARDHNTCGVTASGGMKCWGQNSYGKLGDGTTTYRRVPTDVTGLTSGAAAVGMGDSHTCAITTGGGAKCWGYNHYGQLGDSTTTDRMTPTDVAGLTSGVVTVAAGAGFTCAVMTGGGVKCWGDNSYGQLGVPAYSPLLRPLRALGFGQIDFDRDDVADVAVYRPSTGTWFSLDSSTKNSTYQHRGWGVQTQGDVPAAGDYDGDGIIDPTVYRPAFGTWFVLKSSSNYAQYAAYGWGSATDTLMPGDYDGDGATDMAVYRPTTAEWFVLPSSTNFTSGWAPVTFGDPANGDVPIAGDFDGDGKRDPAVYRPSTGTWFWLKSSTNYAAYDYRGWGVQAQGDTPAPGDYDGDGKTDPTVYRPQYGTWFVLESSSNYTQYAAYGWGAASDTLVPADYDGDGRTDAAIYRPATGEWWVRPSGGALPWSVVFGQGADVPLVVP